MRGGNAGPFDFVGKVAAVLLDTGLTLLVARDAYTHDGPYDFLAWNAFLASVPYALAAFVDAGRRRRAPLYVLGLGGLVWLLFLPNALYMVTDFVHLGDIGRAPVWFDAAMIGSFACAGLLLGFASVHRMQSFARQLGSTQAWLLTVGAIALSTVGIYRGRVLQLTDGTQSFGPVEWRAGCCRRSRTPPRTSNRLRRRPCSARRLS